MSSLSQWNMEEAFCKYLKENCRGSGKAVSSKTLEAAFHVKGTEVRKIVNALRCKGNPICSDFYGYYYAANQQEIDATVAQLDSRIRRITQAKNGLVNCQNYTT